MNKIQIGAELTRGLGCGGNPALGQQAAIESEEALRKMLQVRKHAPFSRIYCERPGMIFEASRHVLSWVVYGPGLQIPCV